MLVIILLTCVLFWQFNHARKLRLANTAKAPALDIDNLNLNVKFQDNPSYFTTTKSCNEISDHEYDDTVNPTVYTEANPSSLINTNNAMTLNCINLNYNGSTV